MELVVQNCENQIIDDSQIIKSERKNFIEANTIQVDLNHLKTDCIIPVFAKDNESTISHYEFVKAIEEVITDVLGFQEAIEPEIRVSHVIKGRSPSAIGKSVSQLLEEEKTIYYERMAFVFEIPNMVEEVNGNLLKLCIGGVRAYNQENLFSKKSIEKFKVFIGFQNTVCTNLCISTDGLKSDIRVASIYELKQAVFDLINSYDRITHVDKMKALNGLYLSESQFAYLVGKMKLYPYVEKSLKKELFQLNINDSQINCIVKDYFQDVNFSKQDNKISVWNFYNLYTEANKSTYIDTNFEKNVGAYEFSEYIGFLLKNKQENFFVQNNNIAFL